MEISITPTFEHIKWVVRNFFELPHNIGFFLDSPEFIFSGDSYCLRLYPKGNDTYGDKTQIQVRKLSANFPQEKVFCKVGYTWREPNGDEGHIYHQLPLEKNFSYPRSLNDRFRSAYVPEDSITVVCSMCLREESRVGSPESETTQGKEVQKRFPRHNASFSSQWISTEMELTTQSPCAYVHWTVPDFIELLREMDNSLISPEFTYAGDTYCLRFLPNEEKSDTDLQLVRLTFNLPERTVIYRIGHGWSDGHTYQNNSRTLFGSIGFCLSRSQLEEYRLNYLWGETLRVLLFLCLQKQSSAGAGTSDAGQKWCGLPGIRKLQCDYRQLLQKGTESDACFVVRGKEFPVHRVVLRARSTVFEAMFGHDTTEKESGRVVVDDLDPDSFGDFLEYLYTGNIGAGLSDDNVFELYVAADKYGVHTLKSECMEYKRRTLTVDSFCDVMTMALRHYEDKLLQQSIQFFKDNLQAIVATAKWKQFVIDNGASVSEFLIKAFVPETQ